MSIFGDDLHSSQSITIYTIISSVTNILFGVIVLATGFIGDELPLELLGVAAIFIGVLKFVMIRYTNLGSKYPFGSMIFLGMSTYVLYLVGAFTLIWYIWTLLS